MPALPLRLFEKYCGYVYEGHLRGLPEPAQAGFVDVAEGFSPTAPAPRQNHLSPPDARWTTLRHQGWVPWCRGVETIGIVQPD